MALDTYSNLKTAVGNWLNKSNLTSYIPDFISITEADFGRKLRTKDLETSGTDTFSTSTLDLSSVLTRYKELKMVYVANASEYWIQNYVSPDQFFQMHADTTTGQPRDYTLVGDTMYFGPAPDSSYTWVIWYTQSIQALSDSNATNSILTNHPDIYLYGALTAAEPFLKNDARLPVWKSLYEEAIESANQQNIRRYYSRTSKQTSEMGTP